jgi:alpha-glucosidase
VYQVYPRSFADGNGDGVGDLVGLTRRLDHLVWLGVDAVWLSPIYRSPMADFGYDVSDYCDIDPVFGSLEDFDRLLAACHRAGIRLILDWVPNHTSIEHPWFVDSRSSRESDHRSWYVWRDSRPAGGPPNNWTRMWSTEPAWTFDDHTGQWFLHVYLPQQPDLNWHHADVEAAMHQTLRFWLERGVDGFRADVVHLIGKNEELANFVGPGSDRPTSRQISGSYGHVLLQRIRSLLDAYPQRPMMVGEVVLFEPGQVASYYGNDDELHQVFDFRSIKSAWTYEAFRARIEESQKELGDDKWGTWVLGNHDNPRQRTRLGTEARARAAAVLLLGLRGTPYLFAGEELGLPDAVVPPQRQLDPAGRDGCRAPIPWTAEPSHGWGVDPWLPFVEDAGRYAVAVQRDDLSATLHLYRRLLALRRSSPALRCGRQELLDIDEPVLGWIRHDGSDRRVILVNFSAEHQRVDAGGVVEASSDPMRALGSFDGSLAADEAVVIEVAS